MPCSQLPVTVKNILKNLIGETAVKILNTHRSPFSNELFCG